MRHFVWRWIGMTLAVALACGCGSDDEGDTDGTDADSDSDSDTETGPDCMTTEEPHTCRYRYANDPAHPEFCSDGSWRLCVPDGAGPPICRLADACEPCCDGDCVEAEYWNTCFEV